MHIHAWGDKPSPEKLLSDMENAGVFGGAVFSSCPVEAIPDRGASFEDRLAEALAWAEGTDGRIIPVLWIHPHEENIIEKLHIAKNAGIRAFKIICTDFYVYEERSMAVLREIAKLDLPVIFHTGILWDGQVSSDYNRPLNWETLLDIEGLRFSLGHCSWPWIDECIALYGKFLHAKTHNKNVDMFFDITPGTPKIYRRELLTKLYKIGYNVSNNILFGSDATAASYGIWVKDRLDTDRIILDELGVSLECREKLYEKNFLRFIGEGAISEKVESPVPEKPYGWSAVNPRVKEIIQKWYEKLDFPKSYDKEFCRALSEYEISDAITIENYDKGSLDGKRNLLSFLYLCEGVSEHHKSLGIPEEVTIDTLRDVVAWTVNWSCVKGELYLGELSWLQNHFSSKLFRLGRLQFCMGHAECDVPKYNIKKGDSVLEVHIPEGGKLSPDECKLSFANSRIFFDRYFPNFEFKYITCHSWLLDSELDRYLPEGSNIIKFGDLFDRVDKNESFALIRYLFRWDTTPENIAYAVPNSSFAEKVRRAVMRGEKFREMLGILKEDEL